MIVVEIDQNSRINYGYKSKAFITDVEVGCITINHEPGKGNVLLFKTNSEYAVTKIKAGLYNGNSGSLSIRIWKLNDIIKFEFINDNNETLAIAYPANNDADLTDAVLIHTVEANTIFDYNNVLNIQGQVGENTFIQSVVMDANNIIHQNRGFKIETIEEISFNSIEYYIQINSLDKPTSNTIEDLVDTTADLSSESASKFVSR